MRCPFSGRLRQWREIQSALFSAFFLDAHVREVAAVDGGCVGYSNVSQCVFLIKLQRAKSLTATLRSERHCWLKNNATDLHAKSEVIDEGLGPPLQSLSIQCGSNLS